MKLEDFDYPLPKELIAQVPLKKRDESKLMIVDKETGGISIKKFKDIVGHIDKDDVLVINDTRVFPARLFGKKNTGGRVEFLLIKKTSDASFSSIYKSSKPLKIGQNIYFDDDVSCEVISVPGDGKVEIRFNTGKDIFSVLEEIGFAPLPPYIKREESTGKEQDKERYQTVYAQNVGAVAAPTAGFHFTKSLLGELKKRGVKIVRITLHVGLGTFLPVRTEDIKDHEMHEEYFSISDECIEEVTRAKQEGNKVIAVGTTSVRALEAAFNKEKKLVKKEGGTKLFIYPGYKFKMVDAMITNFHLPKSTLFMLVCAFSNVDLMKLAYKKAVEESFRFFSYGDAMYIF